MLTLYTHMEDLTGHAFLSNDHLGTIIPLVIS